jgi:hypothetical protein
MTRLIQAQGISCLQCIQTGTEVKKYGSSEEFADVCAIGDKPADPQADEQYYVTVPVYATYY